MLSEPKKSEMYAGFINSLQLRIDSENRYKSVVTTGGHKTQSWPAAKFRRRARLVSNYGRDCTARLDGGTTEANENLKRLAVLVSGGGRSVENICERIDSGRLCRCEVSVVVCSKQSAGAIDRVSRFGIPTRVVRLIDYDKSVEKFSNAVSDVLDAFNVDLVVMAGWMHFYRIPDRYLGRVINIHPSLIPAFCGKGFYGTRVHEAVVRLKSSLQKVESNSFTGEL